MKPVRLPVAMSCLLGVALGCRTPSAPDAGRPTCPTPHGEFPPTDCALLQGRAVDAQGSAIAHLGIRVDSVLRPVGYAYASNAATTGADGSFRLTVFRINRFQAPVTPDTVTLELKAYRETAPRPSDTPIAVARLTLRFAPMAQPVEPTAATLSFRLP